MKNMRVMFEFDPTNYDRRLAKNEFDFRRMFQTTSLFRICQIIVSNYIDN